VIYENLCRDTPAETEGVFAHLGLAVGPQTRAFIQPPEQQTQRSELGVKDYFSVYRNPLEVMDKWRTELTAEQIGNVREVCEGSAAVRVAGEAWTW